MYVHVHVEGALLALVPLIALALRKIMCTLHIQKSKVHLFARCAQCSACVFMHVNE